MGSDPAEQAKELTPEEDTVSGRRAKRLRGVRRGGAGGAPVRKRLLSRVVFYTLTAAVLATAGYLLKPALFGRGLAPKVGVVDISADMGGFRKTVLRVKAGEPVTIRLTSLDNRYHRDGGGKHQFAIDELGVDIVAPALGSASQTFTPTEPGTYLFYCGVCCGGRANPTMNGKLIVEV
ncbi:MAG: hypothetical protein BMS9Abin29_0352 [Gemmatimonadota bacterium]|nr:MAG: hypothetical protein BMS9Abin29_0352 [Gemmatimonadota bacterium]